MSHNVVDQVDELYEKLKNGGRVPYDIASMFHSENGGFTMKYEQGEKAIGIIQEGSAVKFFLYDIYTIDGDDFVEEFESFGIVVDNRTEMDLINLIEAAGHEPLPLADNDEDEDDAEDLDYLG